VTPDGVATYTVIVDRDDLIAAEASFRRILQGRGRKFSDWFNEIPVIGARNAFRLLQALLPLGWFLGAFVTYVRIDRGDSFFDVLPWGLVTLLFGVLAALFLIAGFDLMDRLLGSVTDRLWARTARKVIEKTLPIAPFRVTYTVEGDTWRTTVEAPAIDKTLRRADVHEIVFDGIVCLVFKRATAQYYSGVVWAKKPEIRAAIEALAAGE
jgi:hypothetical protein